jgi:hypothetical protein
MSAKGIVAVVLALVSTLCAQSAPPSISRSLPLAKEIGSRPFFVLRSGCAEDGSFLLSTNSSFWETGQRLVRIGKDGNVLARYDAESSAGLGQIRVSDYALGASGEVHVLAHKISELETTKREDGSVQSFRESYAPSLWLLSFDANGEFLRKREFSDPPAPAREGVVALPSGNVFITGTKGTRVSSSQSGRPPVAPPRDMPQYAYLTALGQERSYVELPPVEDGFTPAGRLIDVPLVNGQEVWVVRLGSEGATSSLFVFRPDGVMERSVKLELPPGAVPGSPRPWRNRLLVTLYSSRTHRVRGSRFVELDTTTGKLLADYSFATRGVEAVCYSKEGPLFLDAPKRMLGFAKAGF